MEEHLLWLPLRLVNKVKKSSELRLATLFYFSKGLTKCIFDMMNLRKSSKKQAKIKLALQGCAGSGKPIQHYCWLMDFAMTGLR